jgi:hypothetical protein
MVFIYYQSAKVSRAKSSTVQKRVGKRSIRDLKSDERAVTELGRTVLSSQLCIDTAFPSADEVDEMVIECIAQAAIEKSLAISPEETQSQSLLTI